MAFILLTSWQLDAKNSRDENPLSFNSCGRQDYGPW